VYGRLSVEVKLEPRLAALEVLRQEDKARLDRLEGQLTWLNRFMFGTLTAVVVNILLTVH
jgi:hypothetical protein